MQPFYCALPAGPVPATKQTLRLARLAKQAIANQLPSLLLLVILLSSAIQAHAQTGGCTTPSFAAATNFYTVSGGGSYSVTTGDFNGDGKPDLAIANRNANFVSVLPGNGTGGFAAATSFSVGTRPYSVTTGDFNGDGKTDLATANYNSNNISVLLGNGTGGFAAATNFGVGTNPQSVITADFNGDGKADIAAANAGSGSVSVLLGNGTGGFAAATNFSVGSNPYSVTTGDFNGDGKTDIAAAIYNSNNVSVLLGNGTGGFASATNFNVGTGPYSVTTGDFNGDGKADIVAANFNSNNVSVLLGNGTGGFAVATNFGAGTNPYSITTGDFNGDGKTDLATANGGSGSVSVLLGNGTGGFAAATNFATARTCSSVITGDFNGDGKADIAAANYIPDNVSVLIGNGTGGFAAATNFSVGTNPYSVTTGDFNGDGKTDLATANYNSNNVSVLIGDGMGGFAAATSFSVGTHPYSVTTGDFNGDGKADIATTNLNSNNVSVLMGNGMGGFAAATNFGAGTNPYSIITADFNGDGKADIATANGGSNNISVLLGNGMGGFAAATNFSVGTNPQSIITGDFNGDGKADIATANYNSNDVSVLLGNGTGGFAAATNFGVGTNPQSITTGDFNGDGKPDLATANRGGNTVSVLLAYSSAGYFTGPTNIGAGNNPESITTGDFNGDGKTDIATVNGGFNDISVLLGNGTGGFAAPAIYGAYFDLSSITTGDFNGDGKTDIVVADFFYNYVSVLLNTCSNAKPAITASGPTTFCAGGSVMLSAPAGFASYLWSNGAITQSITVSQSGYYSVTVTGSGGSTATSDPVTVTVIALPATPTVSVTQPSCGVATGTITVNTPTGSGITYSINGSVYQVSNVFSNVAPRNYNVTAKNSSGCVSAATPVTINAGPADTQAPTIVLKSNPTVFLTAANTYTVQLSDMLQSVSDNCDPNPSVTVSTLNVNCSNLEAGSTSTSHQAYVSNASAGNANYDGQFGMSFKVNSANGVVIDKLGAFDDQGNGTGITGNQGGGVRVAIFNVATQAIVAGLDVTISGTTDPLVGNYRMRSITPVTLAPGNYAIITKGYVGEKFYNRNLTGPLNPAGDNAGGALTFLNTVYYGNAPAFGFPNNSGDAGNPNEYISGTFNYALSASNNVTITATDVSGNTSTATATVTVIDSFYVLTTKTATVNLNANGQASIMPADVLQSLKNNCGVDVTSSTFQVSPSSFTCADISGGGVTPSADNHQAYVSNTTAGNANYDGQFGMSFKVNDANGVSIDKLGAFDDQGNGITGNQGGGVRVAIFNIATQAIVAGLDVTISGATDPLTGSYRMRSITPVTLAPGNYAIITKGYVGEKFYNRNLTGALNPVGDNAGGALSFLNTVYYGNVAAFGFPDNAANAGNPNEYISGTFNYKTLVATGTTVTLTATDVYGNKKQATAQVVVKDVTGPTVITKNITLNLNSSGMASITANDVLQTPVTDNCAVQSVTVSPNSFTCADYSGSGNNGTPHQAYISNTAVGNSNYDGQFGMSFKVNSANGVVIDKLGAFDDQGNGITGSQGGGVRVAIFNIATQAIVSGLDVTISGTTDPLVGSYRMRSITPVTLPAGNYVIITRGYVGEKFYNRNQTGALNPVGDNAGGALTFLNTVYYGNVATFGFPDNVADAGNPNEYISGTFNYALNVSNNKIVTVTATDTHGNVTTATATVTLTNTSNSCATPAPVMAYAARNVQTEAPVVLDNVSMTVKVYPNPSSGQFTVQLYNLKATKVSLQVMDANGQVVVQREASLSSKTPVLSIPVDISKHASGIYLIKVISADGVQTAKVVVNR